MEDLEVPVPGPPLEEIDPAFHVYETRVEDERLLYYGEPAVPESAVVNDVWSAFHDRGYAVELRSHGEETVLVAEPVRVRRQGRPWLNGLLLLATIGATLWAGTTWYYVQQPFADPIGTVLTVWPFTVAILGVLGIHELAHYIASRWHQVDASLPYFIPMPSLIGTMGAVIAIRGRIPDRRAMFDIGASGPLAGLVAAVVVSMIGLVLPPVTVPEWAVAGADTTRPAFGYPLVLHGLSMAMDQPLVYTAPTSAANPVLFGGWVGLFVTFLNLLPVGQLDGGHVIRAVLGTKARPVGFLVPVFLFALAGFLVTQLGALSAGAIWGIWGLLSVGLVYSGSAEPIGEQPLDGGRQLLAGLTFLAAVICFTPIPVRAV